jgi:hypothetical protein
MATLPLDTKQQWNHWVNANVAPPFRKRALKAALKALSVGGSAEQAIAAAKQAERGRANYMALSALVLGGLSALAALSGIGLAVLAILFAIASAVQGRWSAESSWMAWAGLALALLAIPLFVVTLIVH